MVHEEGVHKAVDQFEDFGSAEHVLYVLGEFVVMNAAFSFATDVVAQKLEGRWVVCPPRDPRHRRKRATVIAAKVCEEAPSKEPAPLPPSPVTRSGRRAAQRLDCYRAARFACTGVFFCGVVQFVRLAVIDVAFDRSDTSLGTAVLKTVVNQLVFSPLVRAWSMVTLVLLDDMNGGTWEAAMSKLRNSFFEAQGISYMVKPASNLLAFIFFPNHILGQAVVMRTVAFAYNVYFSYTVHKEQRGVKGKKQLEEEANGEEDLEDEGEEEEEEAIRKDNGEKRQNGKTHRTSCACSSCTVM